MPPFSQDRGTGLSRTIRNACALNSVVNARRLRLAMTHSYRTSVRSGVSTKSGQVHHLALENLALRHQLAVYRRTAPRPKLRTTDRLLWVALAKVWPSWKQALVIVSPDTVPRRRGHDDGPC